MPFSIEFYLLLFAVGIVFSAIKMLWERHQENKEWAEILDDEDDEDEDEDEE